LIGAGLTVSELERAVAGLAHLRGIRKGPWELRVVRRYLRVNSLKLRQTLAQLTALGLLDYDHIDRWNLSAVGEHIITEQSSANWRPLTTQVMSAGGLEDEVLAFMGEASQADGCATLAVQLARTVCPTLARVIGWVPEWRNEDKLLVVPLEALEAAMKAAALVIAAGRPAWVQEREEVGKRAEAYSLRHEREAHGIVGVLYVSRDEGDGFGYDLENRTVEPPRLIECKGSRAARLSFYVSANELQQAGERADSYEIQFWGEIDLNRSVHDEYELLRQAGYPQVIADPAAKIDDGRLQSECVVWKVGEP
jgi:hypothetical protein